MEEVNIELNELMDFWNDLEWKNNHITIKSNENGKLTLSIEFDNKEKEDISHNNIDVVWLDKKIYVFPVIKKEVLFKWVKKLPKYEYIFLFIYLIDDNNIAIFSNNIFEYIENIDEIDKKNTILDIDNKDFEKLTSSFYLFSKEDKSDIYKWKSILSFFSTFFTIALEEDDYKNLIYKIKWDSVAFFKSRYMQEKTIKAIINDKKQWESFINAMFYGNLLKNLTFKIESNLIDLNWKWKWWFNITTTINNEKYFEKINSILFKINNVNSIKNDLPVFFLEWNIWKDDNVEFSEYAFIDMFPRVFKDDNKWNIYLLDFKSKNKLKENDTNLGENIKLNDFFYNFDDNKINLLNFKANIKDNFQYILLDSKENEEDWELKVEKKSITDNDLFILFSKIGSQEIFLWKIKETCISQELVIKKKKKEESIGYFPNCYWLKEEIKKWLDDNTYDLSIKDKLQHLSFNKENLCCKVCEEKNKNYFIEAYKLYTSVWEFKLDNHIVINKSEKKDNKDFIYKDISNNKKELKEQNKKQKVFWFKYGKKYLSFNIECQKIENDWLEYFFNGANISWEDMISLWLISQLNKWKINIWNKKTEHWELADIVWIKKDGSKSIVHLIHMKTWPFVVNWKKDSYSYYTTAIWQMLQKIEPILNNSVEDFFSKDVKINDIKNKICNYIKPSKKKDKCKDIDLNIELSLIEDLSSFNVKVDFLKKIEKSKAIELRVWIAILKKQLEWDINNKVFFMVENILLKWFEHTIKPFLTKEVEIVFYPIVIDDLD